MKKTPVRAILIHSGPDSGTFWRTDDTPLTSTLVGRVKRHRAIYHYQPDFRYPSPLYLLYPKDYLSYIADPAEDAELQNLLRCWDEGKDPVSSREECQELTVRLSDKSTVNIIVRPADHPRLRKHLEWLEEHRADRPTTEFKAEQVVYFGRAVDYRISMTSVGRAKPNASIGASA